MVYPAENLFNQGYRLVLYGSIVSAVGINSLNPCTNSPSMLDLMRYRIRHPIMAGVCVALVSGGIDSPVAVARMLMQGWKIYPVHASQEPVTGREAEKKTIALLRRLLESEGRLGELARKI